MKFLCVECDEPMKLTRTRPPDDSGSLAVFFACPTCLRSIAMLTNAWETEMVSSLGVKIGPAEQAAAAGAESAVGSGAAPSAAGGAVAERVAALTGGMDGETGQAASRCPFSGVVREMEAQRAAGEESGPRWTEEALARLEGIPEFVRPMARQGVEHYAETNGYGVVDVKGGGGGCAGGGRGVGGRERAALLGRQGAGAALGGRRTPPARTPTRCRTVRLPTSLPPTPRPRPHRTCLAHQGEGRGKTAGSWVVGGPWMVTL
jgi:hypothetical protein